MVRATCLSGIDPQLKYKISSFVKKQSIEIKRLREALEKIIDYDDTANNIQIAVDIAKETLWEQQK